MAQRRNLTIGVTVNLEHYENLRLEVSGEICDEKDSEELITYVDDILSRLGRGTPETAERVDSYRRRVLARPVPSPHTENIAIVSQPVGITETPAAAPTSPPLPASASSSIRTEPATLSGAPIKEEPGTATQKPVPPATSKPASPPPMPPTPRTVSSSEPASGANMPMTVKKEITPAPERKEAAPEKIDISKEVRTGSPRSTPTDSRPASKEGEFTCERCGEPITAVQRKLSRMFQNKDLCKKCLQTL